MAKVLLHLIDVLRMIPVTLTPGANEPVQLLVPTLALRGAQRSL